MAYVSLTKIFYQDQAAYEESYALRYHSPAAKHFPIEIQQFNRPKAYPLFFNYTEDLVLLVEQIYRAYNSLLLVMYEVPPIVLQQFSLLSVLDEVKASNDMEGVQSTRKELKEILDGTASQSSRFYSVIDKYRRLLTGAELAFSSCQELRTFYDDFAHEEVVKEDPQNSLDGAVFRKGSVDIASPTGKTIHQGSYPEERILELMEQALAILHGQDLPFLVRLSLFHYLFAYIHPFYDGNGRTIRFITSYFLAKHFNVMAALRLSVLLKKKRKKYYALFQEAGSELNRGDMTPFILGFLSLLLCSFQDTVALLQRKQKQLSVYEERLARLGLEDGLLQELYYILLQAALFYGQGASMAQLMKATSKSRGSIQKRLAAIPAERLLVTKAHKTKYYKLNMRMFK